MNTSNSAHDQLTPPDANLVLQEIAAPPGWSAVLLLQDLPVDDEFTCTAYREAVTQLMARLPAFVDVHPEEVFLIFERCRPDVETKVMRENARWWMPEFGVGIWLDREPPTTWSREEFEDAAPGTLRPVIERVVRIAQEPTAQASAWRRLLGSGSLLRISAVTPGTFVSGATELLQPTLEDPSLTSFSFYVPLLRANSLSAPSSAYDQPLGEHLPTVQAYLRESVEDGGMLFLVRDTPEVFWKNLLRTPLDLHIVRTTQTMA